VTFLEAALLGTVQGLFMFIPVSSTAHLVLTQHLLIRMGSALPAPESGAMILFDLVVHVGTLVSVVVVFRRSLVAYLAGVLRDLGRFPRAPRDPGRHLHLGLMAMLSVLATGTIGLGFRATFEHVFATPRVVAATLVVTGALLWWTDRLPPRPLGLRAVGPMRALLIGGAQGLALAPGISRSGMTIAAALLLGLKRRWAAEYSFLIAFPTILAATLVEAVRLEGGMGGIGTGALATGFLVAALVGVFALVLVLKLLYRARLRYFSFYLFLLAALVGFGILDGLL
jgi:undecaprenyl-diphosphatase